MHKSISNFLLLFFLLLIAACSDDDKNKNKPPKETFYIGSLTVQNPAGGSFTRNNIKCDTKLNENMSAIDLDIFKIKFAEAMPITIDMSVPSIPCTVTADSLTFTGNNIIPMMGTIPQPNYTFKNINGKLSPDKLIFTAEIGAYSVLYTGTVSTE